MSTHVSTHAPLTDVRNSRAPVRVATAPAVHPIWTDRIKSAGRFIYELLETYGEARARRTLKLHAPALAARLAAEDRHAALERHQASSV